MPECSLCGLATVLTQRLYYEDRKIIVINCPICSKPVMIVKAHKTEPTEVDKEGMKEIARELFGKNVQLSAEKFRHEEWEHTHWHILL